MEWTDISLPPDERYSRHSLIDWWNQDKLTRAKVLVVGAGALGNEVLKNLALIGVGSITVIDFDTVSITNLTRSVLFRESDVNQPKVEVARRRILEINPDISVRAIQGDLEFDLGIGNVREHDIIIGCLDSVNARWAINNMAYRAGIPWINGGIGVVNGEISFFDPNTDAACYECTITDRMWKRRNQRYSCQGLKLDIPEESMPTTATIASIIAAMEVQQALLYLHQKEGVVEAGEKLFLNLNPWNAFKVKIPRQEYCLAHDLTLEPSIKLTYSPSLTVEEILKQLDVSGFSDSVLWLRNEVIDRMQCLNCGDQESINIPRSQFAERDIVCPNCQQERQIEILDKFSLATTQNPINLEQLCLPHNEILHCETSQGRISIQFCPT
jgi:adenylyltransferase/sulfurtransferase